MLLLLIRSTVAKVIPKRPKSIPLFNNILDSFLPYYIIIKYFTSYKKAKQLDSWTTLTLALNERM
jgi:hypothetical protein